MASTIIPPGYMQGWLRFTCTGDNEEMLTSFGVRLDGTVLDPVALATAFAADWTTAWPLGDLANTYVFRGSRVYVGQDGDPLVGEFTVAQAGTGSNASLPNNCACLIQKRTAVGGRRNRGRSFVPAGYLPETGVDQTGTIAAPTLGTLQGNANDWLARFDGSSAPWDGLVILHSSAPTLPTVITSLTVASKIGTQRTRMRR